MKKNKDLKIFKKVEIIKRKKIHEKIRDERLELKNEKKVVTVIEIEII